MEEQQVPPEPEQLSRYAGKRFANAQLFPPDEKALDLIRDYLSKNSYGIHAQSESAAVRFALRRCAQALIEDAQREERRLRMSRKGKTHKRGVRKCM